MRSRRACITAYATTRFDSRTRSFGARIAAVTSPFRRKTRASNASSRSPLIDCTYMCFSRCTVLPVNYSIRRYTNRYCSSTMCECLCSLLTVLYCFFLLHTTGSSRSTTSTFRFSENFSSCMYEEYVMFLTLHNHKYGEHVSAVLCSCRILCAAALALWRSISRLR